MTSKAIIDALGGTVEVAKLCKVQPQAVSQWFGLDPRTGRERGIPPARLMYLRAIKPQVFTQVEIGVGGTKATEAETGH